MQLRHRPASDEVLAQLEVQVMYQFELEWSTMLQSDGPPTAGTIFYLTPNQIRVHRALDRINEARRGGWTVGTADRIVDEVGEPQHAWEALYLKLAQEVLTADETLRREPLRYWRRLLTSRAGPGLCTVGSIVALGVLLQSLNQAPGLTPFTLLAPLLFLSLLVLLTVSVRETFK